MLSDWYFCCCIGADDEKAAGFLAILETLENPESDPPLLALAFRELAGTDVWMRAYALPHVLTTRHRRELVPARRATVEPYLRELVDILPEDVSDGFGRVVDLVLNLRPGPELLAMLGEVAEKLDHLPTRETTREPYVDLRQFLPETFLLAVFAELLQNDKAVVASIQALLKSNESRLRSLLLRSLDHEFGRLAFRLALDIAQSASLEGADELLDRIWLDPLSVAWLEPDLLRSSAELVFGPGEPAQRVDAIFDESIRFAHLSRLRNASERRGRRDRDHEDERASQSRLALETIGIATEGQARSLPLVYWQVTLWQLATELDCARTGDLLAEICTLSPDAWPKEVHLQAPGTRSELDSWTYQLAYLRKDKVEILTHQAPELQIDAAGRALLLSPWMSFGDDKRTRYARYNHLPLLIRLLGTAFTAVGLLQRLPIGHRACTGLAAFVAHTADVLFQHRQLKSIRLLDALRLFADRQCNLAGQGRLRSIAPETFVAIVRGHQHDRDTLSQAEQRFFLAVMPVVLMRWIHDAYRSATDLETHGRWFALLPEVDGFNRDSSWRRSPLALRFLRPEESETAGVWRDWRNAKGWPREYVELLLSRRLPSDEWFRPSWKEPSLADPNFRNLPITLALERLASLGNPGTLDKATQEAWRVQWMERLYTVDDPSGLDRFVRLRLLELLDHPVLEDLENSLEAQELIALTLLEYNFPYEIKALLERIYPIDREAWNAITHTRQRLRQSLLQALVTKLNEGEADLEDAGSGTDPRRGETFRQRLQVIRECLGRIAYFARGARGDLENEKLADRLGHILDRSRHPARPWRRASADLEQQGSARALVADESLPHNEISLQAAVIDRDAVTATLWANTAHLESVTNLFDLTSSEIDAIMKNEPTQPVALLGSVVSLGERRGRATLWLNCGLPYYLNNERFASGLRPGELVEVGMRWDAGHGELKVDPGCEIRPVRRANRRGDRSYVEVRESWVGDRRHLALKHESADLTDELDEAAWDADLSRNFRAARDKHAVRRQVVAERGEVWLPKDGDLRALLLAPVSDPRDRACVLTFVDEIEDGLGSQLWRFQTRPGENFLLRPEDFGGQAGEIEAELELLGDQGGLLVTVAPGYENGRACLRLVRELPADSQIRRHYPKLSLPFDRRNVDWSNLFKDSQQHVAQRVGNTWGVAVPGGGVPGFPDHVFVDWDDYQPQAGTRTAEVLVQEWDPVHGIILCNSVYVRRLKLNGYRNELEFLKLWTTLSNGDQLQLAPWKPRERRTRGTQHRASKGSTSLREDGSIICMTREGVRVFVEAESLSMRPLADEPPTIATARTVELFSGNWKPLPDLELNEIDLPAAVRACSQADGVVIGRSAAGSQCTLLWNVGDKAVYGDIQILNLDHPDLRYLEPGSRIEADRNHGAWQFRAYSFLFRARALWTVAADSASDKEVYPLGLLSGGVLHGEAAELRPGEIVVLDRKRQPAIASDQVFTAKSPGKRWYEGRDQLQRVVLQDRGLSLTGNCTSDSPTGKVTVRSTRVVLSPRGEGLFALRRQFSLAPPTRQRPPAPQPRIDWQAILEKYLLDPEDLKVTVKGRSVALSLNGQLRVPSSGGGWTEIVPLGDNPFVVGAEYDPDGIIQLHRDPHGAIRAWFQKVPSLTLDEYRASELHADFDRSIDLTRSHWLRNAGYEDADPLTNKPHPERHLRFEWGYGKTISVPAHRVLFGGNPFGAASMVFFYGDAATHVTFRRGDTLLANGEPECILDIDDAKLDLSDATSLFIRRRHHRIVHLLNIDTRDDGIAIQSVVGFEDRNMDSTRRFGSARIKLEPRSAQQLQRRIDAGPRVDQSQPVRQTTIAARLDEDEFLRTLGANVVFRHVRLSFENFDDGENVNYDGLQQGELIFFEAGDLEQLNNDVGLQLRPLVSNQDVGRDIAELQVRRRSFSFRENLLPRILARKKAGGLRGTIVLARLNCDDDGKIIASVRSGPSRRASALRGLIGARRDEPTLANVARSDHGLRLEVEPGVFVILDSKQVEGDLTGLQPGAIVRVEIGEAGFRVAPAALSDVQYVEQYPRAVVAFPKNTVTKENLSVRLWASAFSIGGLPDIELGPVRYERDRPASVDWYLCRRILEMPHPKIVGIRRDGQRFGFDAPPADSPVGHLAVAKESGTLQASLWHDSEPRRISWSVVSYADKPITEIVHQMRSEKWSYHDSSTPSWVGEQVEWQQVGDHDAFSGPIFFHEEESKLRLRYRPDMFRRFGYPADELFSALAIKPKLRAEYTVAGISDHGGLWLELTPGRIVELPGQLLVWRTAGSERSLADMHWQAFAPGDRVRLELISRTAFEVDRAALVEWIPGPRNAFGSARTFLPVKARVPNDSVTLGDGKFILTMPSVADVADYVILDRDNRLVDQANALPAAGDVILLTLDNAGVPIAEAVPDFSLRIDRSHPEAWSGDTLISYAIDDERGNATVRASWLAELIHAVGGALPVTVEGIDTRNRVLFFSRRSQREFSKLAPGTVSQGRITGYLTRSKMAVLQCGGALIAVQMDQLLSGLPTRNFQVAAKALSESPLTIWIQANAEGEIRTGLRKETAADIMVRGVAVIAGDKRADLGVISCALGSESLYWLPAGKAAWTDLSHSELQHLLVESGRPIAVTLLPSERGSRPVSVIDVRGVRKELATLRVGTELAVRVLSVRSPEGEEPARYLAESQATRVMLELCSEDGEEIGRNIRAEVVHRIDGNQCNVAVVPLGSRHPELDLPAWMREPFPAPGEVRPAYLALIADEHPTPSPRASKPISADDLRDLGEDELNRQLVSVSRQRNSQREQALIVMEWVRRNEDRPEIDAPYALMAVLLLAKLGMANQADLVRASGEPLEVVEHFKRVWRRQAVRLTQNLGRRALRSAHVEVLACEWVLQKDRRRRGGEMWERLQQLEQRICSPLSTRADVKALRQFARAVHLRGKADLTAIGDALSAATGELDDPTTLLATAPVTARLIEILRTIPVSKADFPTQLNDAHVDYIRDLLQLIMTRGLDVTLLDPLPPFRHRGRDQTGL